MKDTWYGDHRDLVKWGGIVHLARRENVSQIVHVAFLRKEKRPQLQVDSHDVNIAEEVWAHFRDIGLIAGLAKSAGLNILVVDRPFNPRARAKYIQHSAEVIKQLQSPRIVLLDPDTGIEPKNAAAEHVKKQDIRTIWQAMESGDWLFLYQHASRNKKWQTATRTKFSQVCHTKRVCTIQSPEIASDVAFFATKKEKT